MTNAEKIVEAARCFVDRVEGGELPQLLLALARNADLDPDGKMYRLWCDNCGNCAEEGDICCEDEDHLNCIRRFLQQEYIPND